MVHRLTISYRGTAYAGWQRQNNALAIQQVVEEALGALLGAPVRVHGSGRTDAGVHARGQMAHFELPPPWDERGLDERGLVHGTNQRLPDDIRIVAAHRMGAGFHARKSALGKEYLYRIHRGRVVPPLEAPFTMRATRPLDIAALRRGAAFLPGRHDFTAFALAGGSHGQPFRRLFAATVDERGRVLHLRFSGEGFLRGMVRSLVGTLVEIGEGRRAPEDMAWLLAGRGREAAGPTAPAQGLSLEQVFYPPCWRPLAGYVA